MSLGWACPESRLDECGTETQGARTSCPPARSAQPCRGDPSAKLSGLRPLADRMSALRLRFVGGTLRNGPQAYS
jgi:hypothetical protein